MENTSSMTALIAAFGRAYHSINDSPKIFNDFLARELISDKEFQDISYHMSQGIKFFNPNWPDNESPEAALRWIVQNQLAPIPLPRSKYCEEMLENAIKFGVKQYVILGAGFDTLAFRRPDLMEKIDVFELDHPATQKDKLQRLKDLGWNIPESLHMVPIDFRKQDLEQVLTNSCFDNNKLSFFSWLGVTYYLKRENIFKTLKAFSNSVQKGSSIVFEYPDENMFSSKASDRAKRMVALTNASKEPMLSCFSFEELEAELDKIGLLIYEHLRPDEIEAKYFKDRTDDYHALENVNFALVVKR
jgi:methyltransferase (TIGR00027 family)